MNEQASAPRVRTRRQSLISITKRPAVPFVRAVAVRAVAILAALVIAGVVTILLTGENPISVYVTMFEGAFGSGPIIWKTFQDIAILLCTSLAVTPAFRMRFWNIGAEGQVLAGCLACAYAMYRFGGVIPEWLLMIIMAVFSVLAGAIFGLIPAVFKANWNTNETLFTLMMNYIAIQLVEFFLKIADKSGSNTVGPSILSHGWYPTLFGQKYLLNIIVAAVLTVLIFFYLNYTKHGYEISVVGESENTARYIGVNVKGVIIRTVVLSGAVAGLAGFLLMAGAAHTVTAELAGGNGFTAVLVSWLAKFNPLTMILTSMLIVFLQKGSGEIAQAFRLSSNISEIMTGIILFFIIGCEFFIRYRINFRKKAEEEK